MIYHVIRNIDHSKALNQKKMKSWQLKCFEQYSLSNTRIRATGTEEKKLYLFSFFNEEHYIQ